MLLELFVIFALVLVNGLFAGAEIATVTVRKTRVEQLVEQGHKGAKAIAVLRANPERFLATVQIGITVVGASAAAYGGDTLAEHLTPWFLPMLGAYAHQAAFAVVVAGISFLSLVVGELVPKSLALRDSERYALLVARPLVWLATLTRPLVWFLTESSNAVLMIFGDKTSFTESRVSPDELKAMLEDAGAAGSLHPRIGEIAARAMDLDELRAQDVMVPRSQILALSKDATVEDLRRFVTNVAHSRIPIYEGAIDRVVGYVTVRDAFTGAEPSSNLAALGRPITFVAESMRAVDILYTLQTQGAELAIVLDEYGGTAGLLTREDLAEELLGEATKSDGTTAEAEIRTQPDGSVVVAGTATVREINRELDLHLPESDDWSTVAGMCVGLSGRIPAKGERLSLPQGLTVEILDASPRNVRAVRIVSERLVRR